MVLKKICILFLYVILFVKANSQSDVSNKIYKHIETSKSYLLKNLDSALVYSEKAVFLAQKTQLDTLIAKAQTQKSSVHILKNEFDKGDSILSLLLTTKLPPHIEGQIWHNLGSIQYRKQNLDKALELYIKAAKTTERSKQKKLLLNTYTNIGVINATLSDFKKAQDYLEKAVVLAEKNEPLKLQILSNLSNIYKENKELVKYEKTSLEAERLAKKHNIPRVLATIYTNLSIYYSNDKPDYNKALYYGLQSIELKRKEKHYQNLPLAYNNVAHVYLKNKAYKKAIVYLDSALPNANELLKNYIYNNYKEAYSGLNNHKQALHYTNLRDIIKDSLNAIKQKERIAEITEKYASEKKEQEINYLNAKTELQTNKIKNQQFLILTSMLIIALIGVLGYFWYKNQKTKQSLQKATLRHKLLQTQLNPHFIFHSLNSIQSYIYQNKKNESISYLSNYSKLMRSIFDSTSADFISIADDAETINTYLQLQQMNFSENVEFSVELEEGIEHYQIPPMLVQPYVENAIQHGIKTIKNGIVIVNYTSKNDDIEICVYDNGTGLPSKSDTGLHQYDTSSEVISKRIENLLRVYKFKIKTDVSSNKEGTEVKIRFPKKI